ncbi:MAG: phosphatidylserine decarboxylase family protein [Alphaproteobacteria bacterium]|mgnify:FL=1|nr:phosphatidylserine decarboxylase family protein [Alphaproteobacteria bacterium]
MTSDDNISESGSYLNTVKGLIKTTWNTLSFPVHPAGWPFIFAFALLTIILAFLSEFLGLVGLVLTIWCLFFFRNPIRSVPQKEGLIVSPADGRVILIKENIMLPAEFDLEPSLRESDWTRVSIFLSVFNVHVNRVPIAGKVKQVVYNAGKFFNASLDKASEDNERSATLVETQSGKHIAFVQIAGLVARRILNDLHEDQNVATGQHMGIIRFGSRLDIYLPKGVNPLVTVGQTAIGGETILADLTSKEKSRTSIDI